MNASAPSPPPFQSPYQIALRGPNGRCQQRTSRPSAVSVIAQEFQIQSSLGRPPHTNKPTERLLVLPALLDHCQDLVNQLDEQAELAGRLLADTLRSASRVATGLSAYRLGRVLSSLELLARLFGSGQLHPRGSDYLLLLKTFDIVHRMLPTIDERGRESHCEELTAEAKYLLLRYRPEIAQAMAAYVR